MSKNSDNHMESASEEVVHAILEARKDDQVVWLATVISTWGSSPRPPGSMMVWSPEGGLVGSVSGGCVEEDLIEKFREHFFAPHKPQLVVYGEEEGEEQSLRLPCGGKLQLMIEALHVKNDLALWRELADKLEKRQGCLRSVVLARGDWHIQPSAPCRLRQSESEITIYLGPAYKLLIVGANQVARYLAQFAQALNFSVSVCDPGESTASYLSQKGLRFLQRYPDGLVRKEFYDSASAVVAVSHDPRLDDMALLEALPGEAFYVGAMGSLRTSAARRERLRELGLDAEALQKLKAPIGMDIGSKSPAEIAISIAADLVRASQLRAREEV